MNHIYNTIYDNIKQYNLEQKENVLYINVECVLCACLIKMRQKLKETLKLNFKIQFQILFIYMLLHYIYVLTQA